jgi:SAM-dependent methyltransferase
VTADLNQRADLKLNIEKIALPDSSFDVVICSHVLEHVNDLSALAELYRILRQNGLAILMVPLIEGWMHTYEDDGIHSEADREIHFGQFDHVRYYGSDFRTRVLSAGFLLDEYYRGGADSVRFGLYRGERIFLANKPSASPS